MAPCESWRMVYDVYFFFCSLVWGEYHLVNGSPRRTYNSCFAEMCRKISCILHVSRARRMGTREHGRWRRRDSELKRVTRGRDIKAGIVDDKNCDNDNVCNLPLSLTPPPSVWLKQYFFPTARNFSMRFREKPAQLCLKLLWHNFVGSFVWVFSFFRCMFIIS